MPVGDFMFVSGVIVAMAVFASVLGYETWRCNR